jgi:hypothetical protein
MFLEIMSTIFSQEENDGKISAKKSGFGRL